MKTSLFITRQQYDALLDKFSNFMTTFYLELDRKWSIGGVRVSGSEYLVKALKRRISEISS